MNPFKLMKELKRLRKGGGLALCEACIKKQIAKTTDEDIDVAYKKSIDSGVYKAVEDKKCFVCSDDAKYAVSVKDAMKAVGAHRK